MLVSHSRALAEAAAELGREVLQGQDVRLEVAAGLDDGALGTDATAVLSAVEAADSGDGVVVLMDLGSAVLSAELALDLLDEDARARVVLSPAPLVEGLVAACVAAAGGASRDAVAEEALAGLAGKQAHLGAAPAGAADDLRAPPPTGHEVVRVVVTGPHGLHARPSARLVQAARGAPVRIEARNATTGSDWVAATSLASVAVLGVLSGHELELRASGPGARAALDGLVALVERDVDEAPSPTRPVDAGPLPATTPVPAPGPAAVPASPGVGLGPARQRRSGAPQGSYDPSGDPATEWARLTAARDTAREALARMRARAALAAGQDEAAVFDAHLLLLDDDDLVLDARRRVDAGEPAPAAWRAAVGRVESAFAALPDPYLRSRAEDVRAVGDDVLRGLLDAPAQEEDPQQAGVLVAADLTPGDAAALDPQRVTGVVLAGGSPTSHAAILVRGLGIPAVVAAGPAVLDVPDGALVALDGSTGELAVGIDDEALARWRQRATGLAETERVAALRSSEPARTKDGRLVPVGANVGSVEDARRAAAAGADLAGLVRTEFLFLDRARAPEVEEQEDVYRRIAEALGGRRMTLRTLDAGGDKPLPYAPSPSESNPFLGLRGLRLSLAVPGLLADQLLAVVRVARETPVSVMFPMVTTVAELHAARAVLDEALGRAGGPRPPGLQVGMMVEVPAAALKTAAFAPAVDFFSIGTNDLAQYALAAERGNPTVTALADPYDPGVLGLVAAVCAAAGDAHVAVCGELAADVDAATLLIGLGVHELSVAPRAVARVKQAVRAVDVPTATGVAQRALRSDGAAAVRRELSAPSAAAEQRDEGLA